MFLTQQSELEKDLHSSHSIPGALFSFISSCRTNAEEQHMKAKTATTMEQTNQRERRRSKVVQLLHWAGYEHQAQIEKGFWVRISFPSAKCKLVIYPPKKPIL
jgi:hypothetical protein